LSGLGEQHGNRDQRNHEHDRDRPEAALDQVVPEGAKGRDDAAEVHVHGVVTAAVGVVGDEPPAEAGWGVAPVVPAGPAVGAPAAPVVPVAAPAVPVPAALAVAILSARSSFSSIERKSTWACAAAWFSCTSSEGVF